MSARTEPSAGPDKALPGSPGGMITPRHAGVSAVIMPLATVGAGRGSW